MESFCGTIKTESLHHYRFKTIEHVNHLIFKYIELFYNRIRRHAKIGNQIPADFVNQFYISNQIAVIILMTCRLLNRT
jgi:putative transposase